MKIAGYVRQTPGRTDPDTAFAQGERIRRWVLDTANELIAVCQDHHASSAPMDRPGFKALLDIVRSHATDAVLIANLGALSPDKMTQEIMIQDIRSAGATVIATDTEDVETLRTSEHDHTRMLVRDVLARVEEYREAFGLSREVEPAVEAADLDPELSIARETTDVVVELIVPGA
jgi:DNA invertase Pin-like site-specific DNA recombinase